MSSSATMSSPSSSSPNFAGTAFLLADQARAIMLTTLLDGRALPAGELAYASGVTAQTASSHLAKLLAGGLVAVESEGRHRYYRLAGAHVAQAMEQLAVIQPAAVIRRKALSPQERELQFCRCCYDHLAGRLGVAVTQALQTHRYICPAPGKQFEVTAAGMDWFGRLGLDVGAIKAGRRGLARQCLDWTERQHHLAGPLGVQFMSLLCAKDWLRRSKSSRAVMVTPKGCAALKEQLGLETTAL
ncbi:helix-turn-helix transcriptional regulator [Roseiarcaceae bacterium H3SJ34-1]|uniref:ArsR/SmtB family transcription factor n=1 Tax=Terripilifer ovatus TaxID=3032367 RepID=UPI003AB968ED|nr:helix-turn-helix transcriptional regulator [Roseiarcaceae bacterium H3SJ34-1]